MKERRQSIVRTQAVLEYWVVEVSVQEREDGPARTEKWSILAVNAAHAEVVAYGERVKLYNRHGWLTTQLGVYRDDING